MFLPPTQSSSCIGRTPRWMGGKGLFARLLLGGTRGFGKGLLVDEELARAIRLESAVAIEYWWGVSGRTVLKWRSLCGAGRTNNPGSHRLIRAACIKASFSRKIIRRSGASMFVAQEQAGHDVLDEESPIWAGTGSEAAGLPD